MTALGWARAPQSERHCLITSERQLPGGGYAYETACRKTWVAGPPPLTLVVFGQVARCETCADACAELPLRVGLAVREVPVHGSYSRHDTLPLDPDLRIPR